jgi:hypothetical protein
VCEFFSPSFLPLRKGIQCGLSHRKEEAFLLVFMAHGTSYRVALELVDRPGLTLQLLEEKPVSVVCPWNLIALAPELISNPQCSMLSVSQLHVRLLQRSNCGRSGCSLSYFMTLIQL